MSFMRTLFKARPLVALTLTQRQHSTIEVGSQARAGAIKGGSVRSSFSITAISTSPVRNFHTTRAWATSSKDQQQQPQLTHTDPETGKASMVSVTDKPVTQRTAIAVSSIWLPGVAFDLLKRNAHKKGDVLTVAQIAGIQAAKQTSNLIPLCHPLLLTHVSVNLRLVEDPEESSGHGSADSQQQNKGDSQQLRGGKVEIESQVSCTGNTGVEMEALTGATVAALTVFDMCKAVGKDMIIGDIKVMEKTGGKSGHYKHHQKGPERKGLGI